MEKKLVKGGIYGFIIGLFLAVLFISNEVEVRQGSSMFTAVQLPMSVYIIKLLRFACGVSLGTAAWLWLNDWMKRDQSERPEPSFWSGVIRSFLIVLGVIILLLIVVSLIRWWM